MNYCIRIFSFRFLLLVIILTPAVTWAQKTEVFGGINYYGLRMKEDNRSVLETDGGNGFVAGVAIDSLLIEKHPFRFTLHMEYCTSAFHASVGGQSGSVATTAEIQKYLLSVGFFPLNFRILRTIDLNLGFQISRLIDESVDGTISSWSMSSPSTGTEKLDEKYDQVNSTGYGGFLLGAGYEIRLSNKFLLVPQYQFYYGLSPELRVWSGDLRSMRHNACIGLRRRMK